MRTLAVVMEEPRRLVVNEVSLIPPAASDVVVDVLWSGISTGTEKLLWSGAMPPFPGLSYPLVPGYETAGVVREAGPQSGLRVGQHVFVPGSRGFTSVSGLFGGAARRLVVQGTKAVPIDGGLGEDAVLLALAATAHHAVAGGRQPELIVGHGVLGRLLARVAIALGAAPPVVWESAPARQTGAEGYCVIEAGDDVRKDYDSIYDASGDAALLNSLILRCGAGAEITLAGFYSAPVSFAFPPAFMRELRLRVAAEWQPADLKAVLRLIGEGRLSLSGLISHRRPAVDAASAYEQAFSEPACTKMILDWRDLP
jgi:3-hydroxyethyl bacteriochlorophyllide a dehydrogenase